ncbi:O-antigen ligase family protein [Ruegeria sp. HKCCSP351]|uniref:O-antigen ligase family protein n=1 Tax=Ruegeria sp. HKCCSP351 TaxID=2794832 RepID=UPI001AE34962|nr:O-antigen ligase family protein [Ruegeria sp. HKCCSP351]
MSLVMQSGHQTAAGAAEKSRHGFIIALMILSFVMPFFFFFIGLRLSAYRLYFLAATIPVLIQWAKGAAGPVRSPDILVLLAAMWAALALFANHGIGRWQFAGILVVETVVPYLFARVLIRDYVTFRTAVWWLFAIVLVLVPFALYENITGKPILLNIFGGVFQVYADVNQEPRLGLERAQASMPHPILFGVFCSPVLALSWYVLSPEGAFFKQTQRSIIVSTAVFSSLSSGAFMGVMLQAFLIAWDEILKKIKSRWVIFAIIFGIIYTILELASNRNAFQIIATELTFSAGSAWNRIHIFNHAIDDIFRNPIFGIGLGEWTRPKWMKPSVDNFWLLIALRYGIPALIFLGLAVIIASYQIIRAPLTGLYARVRTGFLISFLSLSVSAFTVHLWDATYCLFMFLLGSGMWLIDARETPEGEGEQVQGTSARREIRYTRFPKGPDPEPAE